LISFRKIARRLSCNVAFDNRDEEALYEEEVQLRGMARKRFEIYRILHGA
jgi:hypothetical protein